jgi:hypothetical protein
LVGLGVADGPAEPGFGDALVFEERFVVEVLDFSAVSAWRVVDEPGDVLEHLVALLDFARSMSGPRSRRHASDRDR